MKLGLIASALTICGALAVATFSASPVDAADACQHKDFKTEMVKNACTTGGQKAAKDEMKKFMKAAKIKSCNACHSKLAPSYDLKKDAYEQFTKAGGKMLPGAK